MKRAVAIGTLALWAFALSAELGAQGPGAPGGQLRGKFIRTLLQLHLFGLCRGAAQPESHHDSRERGHDCTN